MAPAIVCIVLALIVIGLPLMWYNQLVRLKTLVAESWRDVDVQLKRRYDLIPNLVATVKGYATHEQETLTAVTAARAAAVASTGPINEQSADEQKLVLATKNLIAVAERYPQLKAADNFLSLQQELTNTEDRIAAARRFYNANVRDYNICRTTFPTMLAAKFGDFPPSDFFQVDDYTTRQTPNVAFDQK